MVKKETFVHAEATVPTESAGGGWGLLRTRDFGFLWSGQVVSQIGDGLNKVALLWFVYELTGSALKMTLIGLLQTIPPLVLGPLIGVYLDRLPKKPVMIWVDSIRTFMVLLIPVLHAFDALTLERLYALVFLIAIVSTIFGPALASAVPLIVSRSHLTAANALIQSTTNIGVLVGPAVSGVGIALIGAHNVLYVNALTFFISVLCLLPIRVPGQAYLEAQAPSSTIVHDMMVGFRFIFVQQRTVLALMITATLYSLAASAFVFLLPVFAKDLLRVGPVQLGWLWSALGVGMLVASAWLAWLRQGDIRDRLRMLSGSMAIGGVAVCSLSLLGTPLLAAGLVIVIGGSTALFTPVVWAMLQEMTPGHLMARVLTTFSTGGMFSAMVGMMGFGWAADTISPAASLIGIGVVLLATALLADRFSRRCGTAPRPVPSVVPAA
jgi:DHA3 family macrolide efflux protein-like MFS transporter